MSANKYSAVFQPLKVGPLTIKNRMEVSPAEYHMCSDRGWATREFVEFAATMASSGAGIVTIGDSPVTQEYFDICPYTLNMADPLVTNSLTYVSDAIHRYDAVASIELNLRNEERKPEDYTVEELKDIINAFATAALRAKQGGFDMVMVHAGHGHVVDQFFHPFFNKRTDQYGTDTIENRCRFAKEVVMAVREAIGKDMAIEMRMSGDERLGADKGMGIDAMVEFAKYMQDYVDLLHVSSGNLYDFRAGDYMIQGQYMPRATNVDLAAEIKKHVNIPVVSVGKFTMPLAEKHISAGDCDMVAMIRGFISDPECIKKCREGRDEDIRPCLRCNGCTGGGPGIKPKPTHCGVNPLIGREIEFPTIKPAETPKKVAIVGGGAGGMEAARWLAKRGHMPTIYEKGAALGGNLVVAGMNELKADVKEYAEWSIAQVKKDSRITVKLNTEMTPELLAAEEPDAVILALGASPITPNVPGIDLPNVVQAVDVDENMDLAGERVVIIGAGLTGSETALSLARHGRKVTAVVRRTKQALMMEQGINLLKAYIYTGDAGVEYVENASLAEVTPEGAVVAFKDGTTQLLPCDTVILSVGLEKPEAAVDAMRTVCPETYVIGDCKKPRVINDAVREAFFAAMNI